MKSRHGSTTDRSASLARAKRLFLLNVGFFICLSIVVYFLAADGGEDDEPEAPPPTPEKVWSLQELAYLKGEMQALSERPETMPAYEEEWVRNIAKQAVLRDPLFEGQSRSGLDVLIEEYFKAYTKRFDDYYDPGRARDFGYRIGLKHNPKFSDPYLSYQIPQDTLDEERARIEKAYNIECEAEWRLFCRAFQTGFKKGYPVIKEGVTLKEVIYETKLFDD